MLPPEVVGPFPEPSPVLRFTGERKDGLLNALGFGDVTVSPIPCRSR